MLPYTAKFYSNGTIFDSVGSIYQTYKSTCILDNTLYYLRNDQTVDSFNIHSEEQTNSLPLVSDYALPVNSIVKYNDNVYGFRGYNAKHFNDYSALYIENENLLVQENYDFTTRKVLLSSQTQIRDFFIDDDQNYYVIHNQTSISKFTKERRLLYTISANQLSSVFDLETSPEFLAIDYVREYSSSGQREYPIVLGRLNTSQLFLCKLDDVNVEFNTVTTLSLSGTYYPHSDSRHVTYNLTNYNYLKNKYKDTSNKLTFKLTLKNVYNNRDVQVVELPVDISAYTVGYHHFAFRLDTIPGHITLFVDGRIHSKAVIPNADYTFQDITKDSICVGATYFYNNIPLFVKLNQPNFYMIDNCRIKQFKVYDKAVTDDDIRLLTYNNTKMSDLIASFPSGQRNEIDQIERMFSFNVPGSMSNNINVIIKDSNINNPTIQNQVKTIVREKLLKVLPVATNIKNISFKDTRLTFNQRASG